MENSKVFTNIIICFTVVAIGLSIFFAGILYGNQYRSTKENALRKYMQEQVEESRHQVEYWKAQYDSLSLEKERTLLIVDSLEDQIQKVKGKYVEKITDIESYTDPELERFFADRYSTKRYRYFPDN